MIHEVYNYCMNDSVNKANLRHSHTEKKLISTSFYEKIVNINKDSPLYLVPSSEDIQDFALNLKEKAFSISTMIASLDQPEYESVFSFRKAYTGEEDQISASIITEDYSNLPSTFHLKVTNLATTQQNISKACPPNGISLHGGSYEFQIQTEENTYIYQLQLADQTKHKAIFQKLSQTINQSDIGIQASIIQNNQKGNETIQLLLESENTGCIDDNPIFTIIDSDTQTKKDGIINFYQLNRIQQFPSNANFEIDEEVKTSLNNHFTLNHSLRIDLHSTTANPVEVAYHYDDNKIMQEVNQIATCYNSFIQTLTNQSPTNHSSKKLLEELYTLFLEHQDTFSSNGITMDEEHLLNINSDVTSLSAKTGTLEPILLDEAGFFKVLSGKMKQFSLNPMEYLNKTIVTYPNPMKPNFPNPYMSSIYTGMLLNTYC